MSQHKVKIAAVQSKCSADLDANLAAAGRGIRKSAAAGAPIICLQELFRSLYFCQVRRS
jgi:N-carbamoylputrescine amidase